MRDRFTCNSFCLVPIVHDEMNGLATCVKGYAPNLSSNGYYGYQAVAENNKNAEQQQQEQMEVTAAGNNDARNNRKRAWHSRDDVVLKRRRENDAVGNRGQQRCVKQWDVGFLEELLKGTHGGDLYNYYGAGDDV